MSPAAHTPAWLALAAIMVFGLALRLFHLDSQSIWYDEAVSLTASRLPMAAMNDTIVELSWNHPPLHYYLLHVWLPVVGFGSWQARLPSVVFGTLAIAAIYGLAAYLFDRRIARVSALLLAVSQLGVMYSQEARPYAQAMLFVLCAVWCFIIALRERRVAAWWAFVTCAIVMMGTLYYTVLVVAALVLFAWMQRWRHAIPLTWWMTGAVLAAAAYASWFIASGAVGRALQVGGSVMHEQPSWFAAHWWTPISTLNDFNSGRLAGLHTPPPAWTVLVGGALFTAPALLAMRSLLARPVEESSRESVMLLTILWLLPMLLVIGLGMLDIQYDVRYVLFCTAPYYILVARGLYELPSPSLRSVLVVSMLAYSLVALHANYFVPYKENYRDALGYLAREYQDGDCCVFLPFEETPLEWSVYHADQPQLAVVKLDAVVSGRAACKRVWLTTYRRIPWTVTGAPEGEHVLATTHTKEHEERYFWVDVALYVPKSTANVRNPLDVNL